ncbi:hypothetical protein WR25_10306 isoform C [Diploscapter pachys]|uniref:BZIP domain-containing protein n=1 Tax=Diploscapter pachys TaxID=2018661 RepID=A0A2A2KYT0_9BILA|nr:hypothetical protein WR25_10306 isoform C [Diploscapter pachys]
MEGRPPDGSYQVSEYRTEMEELGPFYSNDYDESMRNQTNIALDPSRQTMNTGYVNPNAAQPNPVRANSTIDYFTGTQSQNRAQMAAQSSSTESIDEEPKDPRGCRRIPKLEDEPDPIKRQIYEACFPGYVGTNGTERKKRNSRATDQERKKAKCENRSNFEIRWKKYKENLKDFLSKKQLEHKAILANHKIYRTKRRKLLDQFKAHRDRAYWIVLNLKDMPLKETSFFTDFDKQDLKQLLQWVPTFTLSEKAANNVINPQQQSENLNLEKDKDGIEKTNSVANDDSLASSHAGNERKKNQKYSGTAEERKKEANRIAARKSREKKKNEPEMLANTIRTEMLQIFVGKCLESTLEKMYNETLNKVRLFLQIYYLFLISNCISLKLLLH